MFSFCIRSHQRAYTLFHDAPFPAPLMSVSSCVCVRVLCLCSICLSCWASAFCSYVWLSACSLLRCSFRLALPNFDYSGISHVLWVPGCLAASLLCGLHKFCLKYFLKTLATLAHIAIAGTISPRPPRQLWPLLRGFTRDMYNFVLFACFCSVSSLASFVRLAH